jgi:uncharacterized membrane protein YphA (DoxX/SURF4 family)
MGIAVVDTVADHATTRVRWPIGLRVAFRFACLYWLVYVALNVAYRYPAGQIVSRLYMAAWRQFWLWATVHIFGITGRAATYVPTPSADTTLQYVQQAMFLVIALAGTVAWSMLDRRRTQYRELHSWVRLLVRYALALILFSYGFAKLFPQQFGPLTFARLMEPYSEFSPMGALWSFMGASRPYAVLCGASEVAGATLLLFRRTTTLGAMVAAAAMVNVVALNFSYDVPVKLYSTNILLMAVFVLVPDVGRLANLLVLNRPVAAADLSSPRFERRWARVAASLLWVVFVGYSLERQIAGNIAEYRALYTTNPPPLLGLYRVENEHQKWRAVAVDDPRRLSASLNGAAMTVRTTDDTVLRFTTTWNGPRLILNKTESWTWSQPDADHVVLEKDGEIVRLRKVDTAKLPLLSRGFHWINETAFNY